MKRFKMVVVVGLVAVFFFAGMAFAQGQAGQGAPRLGCQDRFDVLDANHDGKLTKEEFMAVPHPRADPEKVFKTMDVNGHGFITQQEFCAGKGPMGKGMGKGQGEGTNQ